jgi:phosphate transport system protein
MHRHFDDEIQQLVDLLLRMGAMVEDSVNSAIVALEERDVKLAEKVIEGDTAIDHLELEIDQLALLLMATKQPTASDLRLITTVMKVTPELERIADLAQDVCERVLEIGADRPLRSPDVMPLARAAQRMLRDALDAFVRRDVVLAQTIIARDNEVDGMTEQSFREHLTYMMEDPRNISRAIRRTFIGKYFERIADGATNICELVVWLVEGKVIKHAGA